MRGDLFQLITWIKFSDHKGPSTSLIENTVAAFWPHKSALCLLNLWTSGWCQLYYFLCKSLSFPLTIWKFEHGLLDEKVNIKEIVRRVREQRSGMVQTADQYKYLYDVIEYFKKSKDEEVRQNDLISFCMLDSILETMCALWILFDHLNLRICWHSGLVLRKAPRKITIAASLWLTFIRRNSVLNCVLLTSVYCILTR